jgi:hypothetical protein
MAESIACSQQTLPIPGSPIPIHPPLKQQSPTRTDRLFDELRQILDEEPGIAPSSFKTWVDQATEEYIPQRGRTTARRSDYANMVGKKSGRALLREEGKWA